MYCYNTRSIIRWIVLPIAMSIVGAACGGNGASAPSIGTPKAETKGETAPSGQTYKILMQTSGSGEALPHMIAQEFAKRVNEKTNGQVQVDVATSGEIVPDTEMINAIKEGRLDANTWTLNYYLSMIPALGLMNGVMGATEPPLDPNFAIENGLTEFTRDLVIEQGHDIYTLSMWSPCGGLGIFHTSKLLKTPADFNGQKIRSAPGLSADAMKTWGATVVGIPIGETYTAMQLGTVDGAWTGAFSGGASYRFWEVGKFLTVIPSATGVFLYSMNIRKSTFDSYPPEIQRAIQEAADEVSGQWARDYDCKQVDEYINQWTESGVQIYRLTPQEDAALLSLARDTMWASYESQAQELGAEVRAWLNETAKKQPAPQ